jgi:hypothetical protein
MADLFLLKKVHATTIYETWEVLRLTSAGKKPYIAHIFKYTLSSQFPLQKDDLNSFCVMIKKYNDRMIKLKTNMRAPECFNSTAFSQKIIGGNLTYILFEKPMGGYKLSEICTPNCSKQRICRYMLKDFAKGLIYSILHAYNATYFYDVNFLFPQGAYYWGKTNETLQEDKSNHFITIPFPIFYSPDNVKSMGGAKNLSLGQLQIRTHQQIVGFGKFLMNVYKGLDNTTDCPLPSPDDAFTPDEFTFQNLTDVFINLNTRIDVNITTKFKPDEYFGVSPDYIEALTAFQDHTLTTPQAIQKMNDMLNDSFYDFIYKCVIYDESGKTQFDSFTTMLTHNFIKSEMEANQLYSDTNYDSKKINH